MDIGDDGVFHFLTNYLKSTKFIFRVRPSYLLVADKSSKTCIVQRRVESLEFRAVAFGDEFNAAVRQIADDAGDFKAGSNGLGGVTKANALHATGEQNGHPAAGGVGNRLRHDRMKPKPCAGCNVFWNRGAKFSLFGLTGRRI